MFLCSPDILITSIDGRRSSRIACPERWRAWNMTLVRNVTGRKVFESKKETRGHASGTSLIFLQLAKNIYSEFLSNKLHKIPPLSVTSKDRQTVYARINNLMFAFPSFRYERSFVNKVDIKIHFSLRRKNSIGRSEIYHRQRITIYQNIFLPSRISSTARSRKSTPRSRQRRLGSSFVFDVKQSVTRENTWQRQSDGASLQKFFPPSTLERGEHDDA